MTRAPELQLIVAKAADGTIGILSADGAGRIPWRRPVDLAWFRARTDGGALIMGRKTWESIPPTSSGERLPGREKIVLTSDPGRLAGPENSVGASAATALDEALAQVSALLPERPAWIIGGASVYREALKRGLVNRLWLTRVPDTPAPDESLGEVAVKFPEDAIRWREWTLLGQEIPSKDPTLRFEVYARMPATYSTGREA